MIKPTIGRVVWFYPAGKAHTDQPHPALISFVHSDTCINVGGFDMNGNPFAAVSIELIQDEGSYGNPGGGAWACWMPYQKGQAAKTEELEKANASGPAAFGLAKDEAAQKAFEAAEQKKKPK